MGNTFTEKDSLSHYHLMRWIHVSDWSNKVLAYIPLNDKGLPAVRHFSTILDNIDIRPKSVKLNMLHATTAWLKTVHDEMQ